MTSMTCCSWATVHWIKFPSQMRAESLDLSLAPEGAASWKIGPDSRLDADGVRLPESDIWCAVALYPDRNAADAALEAPKSYLPWVSKALEAWHALLLPFTHHGDCNHLDRSNPGKVFEAARSDPGGPLLVLTTAGFNISPDMDMERVKNFRRNVDLVRAWMRDAEGLMDAHNFAPVTRGDDGVTMSLWRDDASMGNFAYRPGLHSRLVERYKAENMADRSSFTRCRIMRTLGQWGGSDPVSRIETFAH